MSISNRAGQGPLSQGSRAPHNPMIDDPGQQAALAFMDKPGALGPGAVERIDTHGAIVFLTGNRAYKIKRAVHYPYMDFSTLALRRAACEAEITRNKRTAPTLYRRTVAITRSEGGTVELDGSGTCIEWAVEMNRFADADLFDRMAQDGRLTRPLMEHLADRIAAFHATAEIVTSGADQRESMRWVARDNFSELAEFPQHIASQVIADLRAATMQTLDNLDDALRDRGGQRSEERRVGKECRSRWSPYH